MNFITPTRPKPKIWTILEYWRAHPQSLWSGQIWRAWIHPRSALSEFDFHSNLSLLFSTISLGNGKLLHRWRSFYIQHVIHLLRYASTLHCAAIGLYNKTPETFCTRSLASADKIIVGGKQVPELDWPMQRRAQDGGRRLIASVGWVYYRLWSEVGGIAHCGRSLISLIALFYCAMCNWFCRPPDCARFSI